MIFPSKYPILVFWLTFTVKAYEECAKEAGGGFCPDGNTCCLSSNARNSNHSSFCIPNDMGSYNATCCRDNGNTGCPVAYQCIDNNLCLAGPRVKDPLVQVLPRYRLCLGVSKPLYGLSLDNKHPDSKVPYYSSHGDLTENLGNLQMVLIVIHGAGRNADDYFCSASAAVRQQTTYAPENVLLIAPFFPNIHDTDLNITNGGVALRWGDGSDPSGTWRYGQAASHPPGLNGTFSSFQALDALINVIKLHQHPMLKKVAIIGHSSGGQFVQRWSLVTPIWQDHLFHGIVANPSSYAYLSPMRKHIYEWSLANQTECPDYNRWPHGLEQGEGRFLVSYVDQIINDLGIMRLIERFRRRNMSYLVGSLDVCNITQNEKGWCQSHGLETSCADLKQGSHRLERHQHYIESLQRISLEYQRAIIPLVGHDHSLIFHSADGLRAIFEPVKEALTRAGIEMQTSTK